MPQLDNRIASICLDNEYLLLTLVDGRKLKEPIKRYIRVEKATPEQRLQWVLTDEDHGINWPQLWQPSDTGMVSVWDIEQDLLYERALHHLRAVQWNTALISKTQHELVALWRMEADINNGGFLQFLGNWGVKNCQLALQALQTMEATQMHQCLQNMLALVQRFENSPENTSLADLPALLTQAEHERLQTLDEAFWDYPDRLSKLVVMHYGAAA